MNSPPNYLWARSVKGANRYEVSTKGDKRFSALSAKLSDGRTIEEAYQLDVKGYRAVSNNWKDGKGKPPLNEMSSDQLYLAYKELWLQWAMENKSTMKDLAIKAEGKVITDMFAWSPISQARALADILNEKYTVFFEIEQSINKPKRLRF